MCENEKKIVTVFRPLWYKKCTSQICTRYKFYVPALKFRKIVGGNSETEGGDGTLGLGEDGQVMTWSCISSCGLSTSFYLEDIGRNAG